MRAVVLLVAALFAAVAVYADEIAVAHYEPVLNFDVSPNKDRLSFDAYGERWNVRLVPSDITEDAGVHFKGRLEGHDAAHAVAFTIAEEEDYITGLFVMANETYWLEAHPPSKLRGEMAGLVIFKQSDIWLHPSVRDLKCHTDSDHHAHEDFHVPHEAEQEEAQHDERANTARIYTLHLFYDQNWQNRNSNPSFYTSTATVGLFNDVDAVYGLAPASFGRTRILSNRYRYNRHGSSTDAQLRELTSIANSLSRADHVHWLIGLNIGGLAYIGTACRTTSANQYKTGVSGLANWSRMYTVRTIAHELGHNRGAQHDFRTGQCSVMSYCFQTTYNIFSSKSVNEMRGAGCN